MSLQVSALEHLTHCASLDTAAFAAALLYPFDALGVADVKQALGSHFVSCLTHESSRIREGSRCSGSAVQRIDRWPTTKATTRHYEKGVIP